LLLESRGYEVISAPDPTLCPIYATLEERCPHDEACGDFLLTDNRMPNMTGLEFVEAQNRRGCKGIVEHKAIISGTWSTQEREKAEKLGCKIFTKPYRVEEICSWLDKRRKKIPPHRNLVEFDGGSGGSR